MCRIQILFSLHKFPQMEWTQTLTREIFICFVFDTREWIVPKLPNCIRLEDPSVKLLNTKQLTQYYEIDFSWSWTANIYNNFNQKFNIMWIGRFFFISFFVIGLFWLISNNCYVRRPNKGDFKLKLIFNIWIIIMNSLHFVPLVWRSSNL